MTAQEYNADGKSKFGRQARKSSRLAALARVSRVISLLRDADCAGGDRRSPPR
jgi:hypothetical protein